MPRRRTDSTVLSLAGAFKKNPVRAAARAGEPHDFQPLPPPPSFLSMGERAAWTFITAHAPSGVLRRRDAPLLVIASRLFAIFIEAPPEKIRAAHVGRMESILSRLGMSPSDASRVLGGDRRDPTNAFDEF